MTDSAHSLRIGELAEATGMTVRTLHHYDQLGLLVPAGRTASSHRYYQRKDIERLYRIQALRQLGIRPQDMNGLLESEFDIPLRELVARQLTEVGKTITHAQLLKQRLTRLHAVLEGSRPPDDSDLLSIIAKISILDHRLRHNYSEQAKRYDRTRGASPSILTPLCDASVATRREPCWT